MRRYYERCNTSLANENQIINFECLKIYGRRFEIQVKVTKERVRLLIFLAEMQKSPAEMKI